MAAAHPICGRFQALWTRNAEDPRPLAGGPLASLTLGGVEARPVRESNRGVVAVEP